MNENTTKIITAIIGAASSATYYYFSDQKKKRDHEEKMDKQKSDAAFLGRRTELSSKEENLKKENRKLDLENGALKEALKKKLIVDLKEMKEAR